MRFRTKERPRGVLRPRDQKRLTLLIAAFGMVLLCVTIVQRPTFWNALFPGDAAPQTEPAVQRNDLHIAAQGILPDEFRSGSSSGPAEAETVTVTARRIPLADASATSSGLPRVPADLLANVRDDVIGVHSSESDAYFASMKMASRMVEQQSLKTSKAPNGAYALFMDSPAGSRGIAWHIKGQLRRLSAVKGRSNRFGVETLFDAWITTADSGDQLVHVVAMKANPDLQRRMPKNSQDKTIEFLGPDAPVVEFTGYFFKREAYASRRESGISLAPLFVAGGIHEIPIVVASSTRAEQLTPYLGWLSLIICIGILLMVWSFTMSDAAHSQTRTHQLTRLPAHASFDDITAVTVGETLSQLEATSMAGGSTS